MFEIYTSLTGLLFVYVHNFLEIKRSTCEAGDNLNWSLGQSGFDKNDPDKSGGGHRDSDNKVGRRYDSGGRKRKSWRQL